MTVKTEPLKKVPLARNKGMGITKCPVCGHPVRRLYRDGRHLDTYKPAIMQSGWQAEELEGVDPITAKKLFHVMNI